MAAQNYNQQPQTPQQDTSSSGRVTMNYKDQNFSFKKYLILGGVVLVLILVGGFLWNWVNSPMLVTVTGTGEVSAPPDAATITFTLTSSGATSQEAISRVKAKVNNINSLLASQGGVSNKDIAESKVRVLPASTLVEGATGFQATISMGVKTVQVSNVDSLVNLLYSNGVSLVSQAVVSIEDRDELEAQALEEAMVKAKEKAAGIGSRNFKFIRKIVAVSQTESAGTSTVTSNPDTLTETNQPGSMSTGVIKVRKTVTVSYKMW